MKLLNEIISELTHVEAVHELNPEDARFMKPGTSAKWGETDPEKFCDECKGLGFCKERHPELYKRHLKKQKQAYRMDDKEIRNLIPLKEKTGTLELFVEFKNEQLQTAHKAFHIEDYETAILNYKAFLKKHSYEDRVRLYVAVCSYFLVNFSSAIYHIGRIKSSHANIQNFLLHCKNVMNFGLKSSEVLMKAENIGEPIQNK